MHRICLNCKENYDFDMIKSEPYLNTFLFPYQHLPYELHSIYIFTYECHMLGRTDLGNFEDPPRKTRLVILLRSLRASATYSNQPNLILTMGIEGSALIVG